MAQTEPCSSVHFLCDLIDKFSLSNLTHGCLTKETRPEQSGPNSTVQVNSMFGSEGVVKSRMNQLLWRERLERVSLLPFAKFRDKVDFSI